MKEHAVGALFSIFLLAYDKLMNERHHFNEFKIYL